MSLLPEIRGFFERHVRLCEGDRLLVGFSGGPDSTALLWGLEQVAPDLGIRCHAVHVDHALDRDSGRRAIRAREICADLQVPCTLVHRPIERSRIAKEGLEAAARQVRYRELEEQRERLRATFIATAHHADDQIETLLIRLLHGSGIEGLAGIQSRQDRLIRPLLAMRREELRKVLVSAQIEPIEDPSNLDWRSLRNRVRHLLLPTLVEQEPDLERLLENLASTAGRSRATIETRLRQRLHLQSSDDGVSIDREALHNLPAALWIHALALAHRQAGIPYPPSTVARLELQRQLDMHSRVGVDCGGGWRWQSQGKQLILTTPPPSIPRFAYTVEAPGECEIPELALRFRIRRGEVDAWMFRQSGRRAGLDLPIGPGDRVVIRNRREGDRVRPFGSLYRRRLKDVLMDRGVPQRERGRLPLLEVNSRLAWIPGVTIDDAFRVEAGQRVWIVELESI